MNQWSAQKKEDDLWEETPKVSLTLVPENGQTIDKSLNRDKVKRQILYTLSSQWLDWLVLRRVTRSLMEKINNDISNVLHIQWMYWEDTIHQFRIRQNIKSSLDLINEIIDHYKNHNDEVRLITNIENQADLLHQSLDGHINSTIDSPTWLYQRRYLDLVKTTWKKYSVIFFDLDALNSINNKISHIAGDIYIATFAKMLRDLSCVKDNGIKRHIDIPIRWGWDEFLLLVNTDSNEVLQKVVNRFKCSDFKKKFYENLKEEWIEVNTLEKNIGFALWTALYKEGVTIDELISKADNSMYKNKSQDWLFLRVCQMITDLSPEYIIRVIPHSIQQFYLKSRKKFFDHKNSN
jgi:diguanylate cyclase (GGDEF)-like protein